MGNIFLAVVITAVLMIIIVSVFLIKRYTSLVVLEGSRALIELVKASSKFIETRSAYYEAINKKHSSGMKR